MNNNIQAMMRQAQKLQQEMVKTKEEIDSQTFTGEHSFVKATVNGKKEILKIEIDKDIELSKEDLEILQDIIVIAVNNALKKVDQETEAKMGKFGSGLQGLI